jgi:hypothetical protein
MAAKASRVPLDPGEIVLLKDDALTPDVCRSLLDFYYRYHEQNLVYFCEIRTRWHKENPGQFFKGLCANVNPLTGAFRPPAEQKIWGWGDSRALGIWSVFLIDDRVPDKQVTLDVGGGEIRRVNLKQSISEYCDILYEGMTERYEKNHHRIPFTADIESGLADDHPRNQSVGGYSNTFAINGFIQYGMLRNNQDAIGLGLRLLDEAYAAVGSGPFDGRSETLETRTESHGPRMILLGVLGEVLKSISVLEKQGIRRYSDLEQTLVPKSLPLIEHILDHHYDGGRPAFWEISDIEGHPYVDEKGQIAVDPGHTVECAGFLAELIPFLPQQWPGARWSKAKVLQAALNIFTFAAGIGFSDQGVLFKYVDLNTGQPLPDVQAGVEFPTAPWWNVRELCAAALRLYTLTREERIIPAYRKAQNASYLVYPNQKIGGQMIQMVDPFTLEPLDVAPATGNLDPMHDPRARIREIENLERLTDRNRTRQPPPR